MPYRNESQTWAHRAAVAEAHAASAEAHIQDLIRAHSRRLRVLAATCLLMPLAYLAWGEMEHRAAPPPPPPAPPSETLSWAARASTLSNLARPGDECVLTAHVASANHRLVAHDVGLQLLCGDELVLDTADWGSDDVGGCDAWVEPSIVVCALQRGDPSRRESIFVDTRESTLRVHSAGRLAEFRLAGRYNATSPAPEAWIDAEMRDTLLNVRGSITRARRGDDGRPHPTLVPMTRCDVHVESVQPTHANNVHYCTVNVRCLDEVYSAPGVCTLNAEGKLAMFGHASGTGVRARRYNTNASVSWGSYGAALHIEHPGAFVDIRVDVFAEASESLPNHHSIGGPVYNPPAAAAAAERHQPSRAELTRVLRRVAVRAERCGGGTAAQARAQIVFASSGRVEEVEVTGVPRRAQACIAREVRRVRIDAFRRATFRVNYPFRIR